MLCTFISRMLGFVRMAVITALFGAQGDADVLNAVFAIPNTLRKLFAEGALSAAFIPVLSRAIIEDPSGKKPRKIARNILAFLLLVLVPLVILFIIFAEPLLKVLVPFEDPAKFQNAVDLFRLVSSYILFISISAMLMGVLNACNVFVVPALTPLLFSVSVISSMLLFHKSWGIFSMALGIVIGGLAQILFQIPAYLKQNYSLKPDFDFKNPEFKQVMLHLGPILASSCIVAVNNLIANSLASGLDDGSVTALTIALIFWQFPFGIFSASITTVLFPRMSRQVAQQDMEGVKATLAHGISFNMILLFPAMVGFMLLGPEIIRTVLERGSFDPRGTFMASRALFYYSLGLFSSGCYMFFQRFFYSIKDFKTPLYISFFIVIVDVTLSLIFKETPLREAGMALAYSIAFTLGLIIITIMARRRVGGLNFSGVIKTGLKTLLSMGVLGGTIFLYKQLTAPFWTTGSTWLNLGLVAGAVVLGVGVTFLMYTLTRIEILKDLLKQWLKK